MRKILSVCSFVVALVTATMAQAAPITVDQSNASGGGGFGQGVDVSTAGILGQTFTPTLTAIDAAEFSLRSEGSSDVIVRLYDGAGYGGTLLGTSGPVTVTAATFTTYHFDFGSTIGLTPSNTYTLQMEFVFGGNVLWADYSESDPYAGGDIVEAPGFDFVFAEGVHEAAIPAPAALPAALALTGVLALRRRRR